MGGSSGPPEVRGLVRRERNDKSEMIIDCVYYNDKTKDSTGEVKGVKVSVL